MFSWLNNLSKFVLGFWDETLLIITQYECAKLLKYEVMSTLEKNNIKIVSEISTPDENTLSESVFEYG